MSAAARRTTRSKVRIRSSLYISGALVLIIVSALILHRGNHAKTSGETPKSTAETPADLPAAPTTVTHTDVGLQDIVQNWTSQQSVQTAVVVRELSGELRSASSSATTAMVPASTYKIYVAYAILHAIEQGTYTLNTKMSSGNTIQADLNSMILNSDNTAARELGFLYGWKNINALLKTQGLTGTDLYNYVPPSTDPMGDKQTTVSDLGTILEKLYAGKLLSADHTQLLLSLMKQQHFRQRIPAGVPSSIAVADKPGWLSPADGVNEYIQNDAAIVYGPKSTYILVVMTRSGSIQPLTQLSTQVYNYLQS